MIFIVIYWYIIELIAWIKLEKKIKRFSLSDRICVEKWPFLPFLLFPVKNPTFSSSSILHWLHLLTHNTYITTNSIVPCKFWYLLQCCIINSDRLMKLPEKFINWPPGNTFCPCYLAYSPYRKNLFIYLCKI